MPPRMRMFSFSRPATDASPALASPEDVLGMSVEDAFAVFDTDGSGKLSYDELSAVLVRSGSNGGSLTEGELERIFVRFDVNMDGEISIQEFAHMWREAGGGAAPAAAPAVAPAAAPGRAPMRNSSSSLSPQLVATLSLEEQAAALASSVSSRTLPLRAVLSNVESAMWPKIDDAVEMYLGRQLRARAAPQGVRGSRATASLISASVAPCAELHDPPGRPGWYNGVVLLFFSPDVPSDAVANVESLMGKLLELSSGVPGRSQRCLHHVIAVPSGGGRAENEIAFFASARDGSVPLRRRWRTVGHPGCQAMSEHAHLPPLLRPLMRAVEDAGRSAPGGRAEVEVT